jgi:hypothetical protein
MDGEKDFDVVAMRKEKTEMVEPWVTTFRLQGAFLFFSSTTMAWHRL